MRHVISVLLQNEVGALTRMTGLFSTRGYNIDSLNVAPTENSLVSRVTLVISGSDEAITQLNSQLGKLVDVLSIHDMTLDKYFEYELVIIKIDLFDESISEMEILVKEHDAELLDHRINSYTVQITAKLEKINAFIDKVSQLGELQAIARSGSVAVSKGQVKLSSYEKHYPLTG